MLKKYERRTPRMGYGVTRVPAPPEESSDADSDARSHAYFGLMACGAGMMSFPPLKTTSGQAPGWMRAFLRYWVRQASSVTALRSRRAMSATPCFAAMSLRVSLRRTRYSRSPEASREGSAAGAAASTGSGEIGSASSYSPERLNTPRTTRRATIMRIMLAQPMLPTTAAHTCRCAQSATSGQCGGSVVNRSGHKAARALHQLVGAVSPREFVHEDLRMHGNVRKNLAENSKKIKKMLAHKSRSGTLYPYEYHSRKHGHPWCA